MSPWNSTWIQNSVHCYLYKKLCYRTHSKTGLMVCIINSKIVEFMLINSGLNDLFFIPEIVYVGWAKKYYSALKYVIIVYQVGLFWGYWIGVIQVFLLWLAILWPDVSLLPTRVGQNPTRADLKQVCCLNFQNGLHRTGYRLWQTPLWTFKFNQTRYGSDRVR